MAVDRKFWVVVVAALGAAGLGSAPALARGPSPADPGAMRRHAVISAGRTTSLDGSIDAHRWGAGPAQVEESRNLVDGTGDAADVRGDIAQAFATFPSTGEIELDVQVVKFDDLLSKNWQQGDTGIEWELVPDGHADQSFYVELFSSNGEVYAGVLDHAGNLICGAGAGSFPADRAYGVLIDTTCIGNPQRVGWRATFHYENLVTHVKSTDAAPDTAPQELGNDAYVPTLPCQAIPVVPVAQPTSPEYVPLSPARLLDTRLISSTNDCQFQRLGVRARNSDTALQVTGRGGVAADAVAVTLNVTVTEAEDPGFVEVYPCGTARPDGSNVNYVRGSTVATAVFAKVGAGGQVCLYAYGRANLVVDVSGYFPPTTDYQASPPQRILDTRTLATSQNPDAGLRAAGQISELRVGGIGAVPADASAVVLNVTAVDTREPGFVTAYPCGIDRPNASNLNYVAGQNVANLVVVKPDALGKVCLFTYGAAHLVVDVSGYFPAASTFVPITPARLMESRPGYGTVDGQNAGVYAHNEPYILPVVGRAGIPDTATAVVLNVTAINPALPAVITVYPCDSQSSPPNASNVNPAKGATVANAAVVKLGTRGEVCINTQPATYVAVDVTGYFT